MLRSFFSPAATSTQVPVSFTPEEATVFTRIQQLLADFGSVEAKVSGLLKALSKGAQADTKVAASVKEQLEALAQSMKDAKVELTEGMDKVTQALGGDGEFPEKTSQGLRAVVMKINTIFTACGEHVESKVVDPIEESLAKDFQEIHDLVLLRKPASRFTEVSEKDTEKA